VNNLNSQEDNIPGQNCKRYFAKDSYGQDLFFIELTDAGYPEYFLSASLPVKIMEHSDLIKLRQIIIIKKTSESVRRHFINKLFELIKSIPEAKYFFFPKTVLDKYGRYSEDLARTYESIIITHKLEILIPYSPYRNEEVFNELRKGYKPLADNSSAVFAEKKLFQENLVTDDLKFAYVEIYSAKAEYFFEQEKNEDRLLEYYFMTLNDELLFLFLIS
jgi:hypothetical protein